MKTVAIVPSAGRGARIKSREPKPYLKIGGKPIVARTLLALNGCSCIDEIIIAVARGQEARVESIARKYRITKLRAVVRGGATRFKSVYNCLRLINEDTGLVVIHDGARPFIDEDTIRRSIDVAKKTGACVVGVPLIPTIKQIDRSLDIVATPPRHRLWIAQTPQVFKRALILKAYRRADKKKIRPTDDSMLVEMMGKRVRMVKGTYRNIKITTPEDVKLAEALK